MRYGKSWERPASYFRLLMTTDRATTFQEMTARLNELTKKLELSSSLNERRVLLRQFRVLLDQVEKLTSGQSATN